MSYEPGEAIPAQREKAIPVAMNQLRATMERLEKTTSELEGSLADVLRPGTPQAAKSGAADKAPEGFGLQLQVTEVDDRVSRLADRLQDVLARLEA